MNRTRRILTLIIVITISVVVFAVFSGYHIPKTSTESFEGGFEEWDVDADVPLDPNNPGQPVEWYISLVSKVSHSGQNSLRLFIDGSQDDGTIWVEKRINVSKNTKIQVMLSFWFYSDQQSDAVIASVCAYLGLADPEVEEDFTVLGPANEVAGWKKYVHTGDLNTGSSDGLWVAVGISVCWETHMTYYVDDVETQNSTVYSLEEAVSRRQSTRSYTSEDISSQQLLKVLSAAYGHFNDHRAIPQIGYDYSLTVFPVNGTGSYRYVPEDNFLIVHDLTVNKETLRPHNQDWPSDSSVVLVVVWNQTRMDNPYLASAEAGCLVQNVYLAAASLNLGTCCVGSIDSGGLREDLGLPNPLIPVLTMPLGYPTSPYPDASPNYAFMTGNLPPVQYSELTFEDTLKNMAFTTEWSAENLSTQELSQLLWAAYGYTNVTRETSYHRTTPSAYGIYPLVIFVSNATGVYQYMPERHSVTEVTRGDKRSDIAETCAGQVWTADAPSIFLVVYNSSHNGGWTGDGGILPHEYIEVDAGTVVQQLFLEASAWGLGANVLGEGLEDWNGTGAVELRSILGLSSSLIPLYVVPIGPVRLASDVNGDGKVNILDIAKVAIAYGATPEDLRWDPVADLDDNEIINILDIATVAKDFGKTNSQ